MLSGLFLTSCSSAARKDDPLSAEKPNIIFLMIDDCSAVEFSSYATDLHPSGNQTPVFSLASAIARSWSEPCHFWYASGWHSLQVAVPANCVTVGAAGATTPWARHLYINGVSKMRQAARSAKNSQPGPVVLLLFPIAFDRGLSDMLGLYRSIIAILHRFFYLACIDENNSIFNA